MGRKITSDRNEDVSPWVSIAPSGELTDTRLQHLVRMEACIFAQYRTRERRD
jgi:hypothetical protein